jgi:carbamoyltransferase
MNYIGLSNGFHDAGVSVVSNTGEILFASHSERYSKHKHDKNLCHGIVNDALKHIIGDYELHYYERPLLKVLRQIRSGEKPRFRNLFDGHLLEHDIHGMLREKKVYKHSHHLSHAAASFQTSPFRQATVVIIDAIGEFDTVTIWNAGYDHHGIAQYKKIYSKQYPNSLGLFYSAMTHKVGLHPMDEEYILMGMAAYGKPIHSDEMHNLLIEDQRHLTFKQNLHIGVGDDFLPNADPMDIASSAQVVLEDLLKEIFAKARMLGNSSNIVYGGGVALNCLANRMLGDYFQHIWIMPNPGDCGSSLGAAALGYGKKLQWKDAFLGHNIDGPYPVNRILDVLQTEKIVGVASGRAEFGPRALGNRSLLADPRGNEIKDKVNEIKRRQKFRPFAPIILEEHVHKYFDMPKGWNNSRYMQVIAKCNKPNLFPAIVHHDGTSRVQTVPKDGSGIRELLEKWYVLTECPMLLNTSLNIRGEPMVNDRFDADRFEKLYNVKVLS